MIICYRVEFTAETTPDDALEVVYGLNGRNVGDERVDIVGTNTTAWFSIIATRKAGTRKAGPIETAVDAQLDADDRVITYSVTRVGADEFRIG
jgi:hypothetical protein